MGSHGQIVSHVFRNTTTAPARFRKYLNSWFLTVHSIGITRRMAIANGTCVSLCNQPKAHFGLNGYAPGTIAVNVTWMERGFNSGQTHRSMYSSIFNRLRAIARYWSEIATFLGKRLHPTCIYRPRWGCFHWNSGKSLVLRKLESWGYQAVKTV